ncbi:decarboxylase dec1 [Diaporthe eres]|nr:decarboxylase dec1 [Diaporthe eres]
MRGDFITLGLNLNRLTSDIGGREHYDFPKVFGKANIESYASGGQVLAQARRSERKGGRSFINYEFVPEFLAKSLANLPLRRRSGPSTSTVSSILNRTPRICAVMTLPMA